MIINVDCDGVLVGNLHEELLNLKIKQESLSYADLSPIWDWYDWLINNNPLPVNIPVLKHLQRMKDEGHIIRLWTNRAYTLKSATMNNLSGWEHLFDTTTFYDGTKHKSNVEGVVIDNNTQYLTCGQTGILYPSFY